MPSISNLTKRDLLTRLTALENENQQLREECERMRVQRNEALAKVDQLLASVEKLTGLAEQLRREGKRQAAPFRRQKSRKKKASEKKKPGRKEGHAGSYRKPPNRPPDREVEAPLEDCPKCGGPVTNVAPLTQLIEEIRATLPELIRLTSYTGECKQCGDVHSEHPLKTSNAGGAASTMLGPRALGVASYLKYMQGLSFARICKTFEEIFSLRVTPGGLSQAMHRLAEKSAHDYEEMFQRLRNSSVVHADETSWYVGEPGHWLWVFASDDATVYRIEKSRGSDIVRDMLGDFEGVLVSDNYVSYMAIDCCKQKCIHHHMQAIIAAADDPQTTDFTYLGAWWKLFDVINKTHRARDELSSQEWLDQRSQIEERLFELLQMDVDQSGDCQLQDRLDKCREEITTCLHQPQVPPDNNRAERALRPAVIARKLSCGNKTTRGKETHETLLSVLNDSDQHNIPAIEYIVATVPLQS